MAEGMSGHMSRNGARDLGMFRECLGLELGAGAMSEGVSRDRVRT